MQEKIVKCPNCGVMMKVKNSKNEIDKRFSCPKCNASLHVKFPPISAKDSSETEPPQIAKSDKTLDPLSTVLVGGVGGYVIGQEVIKNDEDDSPILSSGESDDVGSEPAITPYSPTVFMDDVAPEMPDYMSDADISMMV